MKLQLFDVGALLCFFDFQWHKKVCCFYQHRGYVQLLYNLTLTLVGSTDKLVHPCLGHWDVISSCETAGRMQWIVLFSS